MTPIVHITDKEQALQRENERLTDKTERQSATIHVQAVAIQALQADAERYRWLRDGNDAKYSKAMQIATKHFGLEWDDLIDRARKEQS